MFFYIIAEVQQLWDRVVLLVISSKAKLTARVVSIKHTIAAAREEEGYSMAAAATAKFAAAFIVVATIYLIFAIAIGLAYFTAK